MLLTPTSTLGPRAASRRRPARESRPWRSMRHSCVLADELNLNDLPTPPGCASALPGNAAWRASAMTRAGFSFCLPRDEKRLGGLEALRDCRRADLGRGHLAARPFMNARPGTGKRASIGRSAQPRVQQPTRACSGSSRPGTARTSADCAAVTAARRRICLQRKHWHAPGGAARPGGRVETIWATV